MSITLLLRRVVSSCLLTDIIKKESAEEVDAYLAQFPEPQDDFDRALFQNRAMLHQRGFWKSLILNTGAAVTYLPYLISLSHKTIPAFQESCDAVFFTDRISIETIPDSVRAEFPKIKTVRMAQFMSLTREDWRFLRAICAKAPFSSYFNLKNMLKIAMVSAVVRMYHPKAIIGYWESSPSTSITTMYCNARGIAHIGIMHGDRDYSIGLSFFHYDRYYVWDEDYRDLLLSLRCEPTQFHVELPEAVRLPNYDAACEKRYDYTFYLNGETKESLSRTVRICDILSKKGARIAVRPHPSELEFPYEELFPQADIQYSREVPLDRSLSITRNAIGKYSTVLYQAMVVGISVIIDDYSIPGLYENLVDHRFVPLKRPHQKITELLPELQEDDSYEKTY